MCLEYFLNLYTDAIAGVLNYYQESAIAGVLNYYQESA